MAGFGDENYKPPEDFRNSQIKIDCLQPWLCNDSKNSSSNTTNMKSKTRFNIIITDTIRSNYHKEMTSL
jgi:hypothetical protein